MKIEVLGPPGSGKSFICENNNNKFTKDNFILMFFSIHFITFFITVVKINFSETFIFIKNLCVFEKINLFKRKCFRALEFYKNYYIFSKQNENEYLDDGLIQYLFVLIENHEHLEKYFNSYLRILTPPKAIILFKTNNKNILLSNMKLRKRIPRIKYNKEYFNSFLINQTKLSVSFEKLIKTHPFFSKSKVKIIPIRKYKNL